MAGHIWNSGQLVIQKTSGWSSLVSYFFLVQDETRSTQRLMKCAGCKMAYYCCRNHQLKDWKRHKELCKRNKAKREKARQEIDWDITNAEQALNYLKSSGYFS